MFTVGIKISSVSYVVKAAFSSNYSSHQWEKYNTNSSNKTSNGTRCFMVTQRKKKKPFSKGSNPNHDVCKQNNNRTKYHQHYIEVVRKFGCNTMARNCLIYERYENDVLHNIKNNHKYPIKRQYKHQIRRHVFCENMKQA